MVEFKGITSVSLKAVLKYPIQVFSRLPEAPSSIIIPGTYDHSIGSYLSVYRMEICTRHIGLRLGLAEDSSSVFRVQWFRCEVYLKPSARLQGFRSWVEPRRIDFLVFHVYASTLNLKASL